LIFAPWRDSGTSDQETLELLREALREGLVLKPKNSTYKFLHDRVQEAAYSLVPETQRAELCLRIGRLLLADTSEDRMEERVFDIVSQLNRGSSLPSRRSANGWQSSICGGKRARKSTAYASALKYLQPARRSCPRTAGTGVSIHVRAWLHRRVRILTGT
jgi:predicted ATPase